MPYMGIVIDINDFLRHGNVKYDLPHIDKMLFERCQAAICATSHLTKGEAIVTDIRCKIFSDNTDCTGTVKVLITHVPNQIHWKCAVCGCEGIIKNWKNSPKYIQCMKDNTQKGIQPKTITLSSEEFEKLVKLSESIYECTTMIKSAKKMDLHIQYQ